MVASRILNFEVPHAGRTCRKDISYAQFITAISLATKKNVFKVSMLKVVLKQSFF